jgi:isopenicillin N synthase-like dioxygenase
VVSDISGLSGDADSKAQVANAIREACIHVGFFYGALFQLIFGSHLICMHLKVKNHGVDESVIKSTVETAHRFFDLSLEEKMKASANW